MKKLSGAVLAFVAMGALAFPAKAADFSDYDGKYKSKLTAEIFGQVFFGNATVNVAVSKNGKTATAKINGTIVTGNVTAPISATLRLTGKRTFTTNTLVFNVVSTSGARGTFKQKGRATSYKAPWVFEGQSGTIDGKLSVSRDGKKLKLVYVLADSAQSFSYRFVFDGKRKGK